VTPMNDTNDYVIRVNHATVRFNMSLERTTSLKEYFIKAVKGELMFQELLAVNDVSFDVKRGESWGLLGVNGSGKSTMLKLICGILKPYRGTVITRGRISPLIELGAGFDGEMTARENIFLNGCVLGYSRSFIQSHFDEIVEFAELYDYLDMPIKNYSSGMTARLGFAIATIVKPDILIVDEILAVGDYAFQVKCNKRMKEMMNDGTTLLLVSHSPEMVTNICKKAIWLDKGHMMMTGSAAEVSAAYLSDLRKGV